jgi:hypothetical protein
MSSYSPISPWSRVPGSAPGRGSADIDVRARTGPQFQAAPGSPARVSNLDRCNWCGMPRSSHGMNWSCPSAETSRGTRFVTFVIVAGVLALIGIGLLVATSQTSSSLGTLGAAVLLSGLVLLVCTGTIVCRRG